VDRIRAADAAARAHQFVCDRRDSGAVSLARTSSGRPRGAVAADLEENLVE